MIAKALTLTSVLFVASCSHEADMKASHLSSSPTGTIPLVIKASPGLAAKLLNLNGAVGFNQIDGFIHNTCGGCHRTNSQRRLHVDTFPFTLADLSSDQIAAEMKRRINAEQGDPIMMPKHGDKLDGLALAAMNNFLDAGMPASQNTNSNTSFESIQWTYILNDGDIARKDLSFRPDQLQWVGAIPKTTQNAIMISIAGATSDGQIIVPTKVYSGEINFDFFHAPSEVVVTVGE